MSDGGPVADPRPGASLRAAASWNALSLGGGQIIRVGTALVLTGVLGQENIGIVALATVYVAFVILFVQFGFGTLLIQRERLDPGHVGAATVLSVSAGLVAAGVTVAIAPVIAGFFDTPELTAVLRALSSLVLLKALAIVPSSLLMRQMRFRALAGAELSGTVAGAVVGLTAAAITGSYWAIVWQLLVTEAVTVLATLVAQPTFTVRTTRGELSEVWVFGTKLLGTNVANFVGDNGDNLLIGRVEGTIPLADYTLSYRVLSLPLQIVGQSVLRSLLPVFSRLQGDPTAVAQLFYRAQQAVAALVTGPLVILALAVGDAIPWAFGDEWSSAVTATRWVAVAGILRLAFGNDGATMTAMGKPGWQFWWSMATTAISVLGFVIGIHWGIEGVAASIVITGLPMALFGMHLLGRLIPVSPSGALVRLAPIALAGVALLGVWWAVVPATENLAVAVRLVVRCGVTGLAYLVFLGASRSIRTEVIGLLSRRGAEGLVP
jgi:PST family polysaccharide transporter